MMRTVPLEIFGYPSLSALTDLNLRCEFQEVEYGAFVLPECSSVQLNALCTNLDDSHVPLLEVLGQIPSLSYLELDTLTSTDLHLAAHYLSLATSITHLVLCIPYPTDEYDEEDEGSSLRLLLKSINSELKKLTLIDPEDHTTIEDAQVIKSALLEFPTLKKLESLVLPWTEDEFILSVSGWDELSRVLKEKNVKVEA